MSDKVRERVTQRRDKPPFIAPASARLIQNVMQSRSLEIRKWQPYKAKVTRRIGVFPSRPLRAKKPLKTMYVHNNYNRGA